MKPARPNPGAKSQEPRARSQPTFLITAGPTIEDIDPVRFISNRASGKLGVEIAAAAQRAGHRAILVHGPISDSVLKKLPRGAAKIFSVRSAAEMHRCVMQQFFRADAVIMTAAVADFTPEKKSVIKIKKSGSGMFLRLKPTADILLELGRKKGGASRPLLIGFALETGTGRTKSQRVKSQAAEAHRKLREKNLDVIVLDSPQTMGADSGDFRIILRDGSQCDCTGMSKRSFATTLVKLAAGLLH